jgi:hypothetical protein
LASHDMDVRYAVNRNKVEHPLGFPFAGLEEEAAISRELRGGIQQDLDPRAVDEVEAAQIDQNGPTRLDHPSKGLFEGVGNRKVKLAFESEYRDRGDLLNPERRGDRPPAIDPGIQLWPGSMAASQTAVTNLYAVVEPSASSRRLNLVLHGRSEARKIMNGPSTGAVDAVAQ